FITLDGVVEEPSDWQETFDDDMLASMVEQLSQQDTVLMGRTTYEYWVDYWPTATDEPFATFINITPKFVASTTLDSVRWGTFDNIQQIKGDLATAITQLKQQPGKMIGTAGSPTLIRSLLHLGLLDTLQLLIHPVVAGKGK